VYSTDYFTYQKCAHSDGSKTTEVFEPGNSIKNVALIAQGNVVSVDANHLAAFSKVFPSPLDGRSDSIIQRASGPTASKHVLFGL
jgi:hypothetical protein